MAHKEVDKVAQTNIEAAEYGLNFLLLGKNEVLDYVLDDLKVLHEYNRDNIKISKSYETLIKVALKEKKHENSISR